MAEKGREIRCVGERTRRGKREPCDALLFVFATVPESCPWALQIKCDRCDHINTLQGGPEPVPIPSLLDRSVMPA